MFLHCHPALTRVFALRAPTLTRYLLHKLSRRHSTHDLRSSHGLYCQIAAWGCGDLISSTSVRAHVCLALTSPGRPLANDVAPLEPVAGALLSLGVCLDTATCVPAPASWPTSACHVALCDLQPFSSRAGPCTSACVLLVRCIPQCVEECFATLCGASLPCGRVAVWCLHSLSCCVL